MSDNADSCVCHSPLNFLRNGPLTRYAKLWVAHAPGMPGTFFPPPTSKETASQRSRYASRHVSDARAVMHVGIANSRWWGKRSQHSRCMGNPQFTYLARGPCQNPQEEVVPKEYHYQQSQLWVPNTLKNVSRRTWTRITVLRNLVSPSRTLSKNTQELLTRLDHFPFLPTIRYLPAPEWQLILNLVYQCLNSYGSIRYMPLWGELSDHSHLITLFKHMPHILSDYWLTPPVLSYFCIPYTASTIPMKTTCATGDKYWQGQRIEFWALIQYKDDILPG